MGGILTKRKPKWDPEILDKRHFTQERCIGAGGFGKVHACFKNSPPENNKLYAMKTLDKENIFKHSNGVSEVMDELTLLSSLKHPFVCNIYYGFQDPWSLYLVMDLARGGDLRYRMKQWDKDKKLDKAPEDQIKFFMACIILALGYLHGRKVLHRDIKPENFILEESGYVLLTDFGIADHTDDDGICTKASGTHGYMAPEVYHKSRRHSYTADFFSLGVAHFEMLHAARPYSSELIKGAGVSFDDGLPENFKKPEPLRTKCSPPCADFINALLDFNPKTRLGHENGVEDLKKHKYYDGFDWEALANKKMPPPFIPDCSKANCDSADLDMAEIFVDNEKPKPPPEEKQKLLVDYHFSWLGTNPDGTALPCIDVEPTKT